MAVEIWFFGELVRPLVQNNREQFWIQGKWI